MGKSMENFTEQKNTLGLYDPQFEHDACGIGAVVDIKGRKSHQTVDDALAIVERLEHRAGKDAEGKTGDGVGILLQISHKFFSKVADELNIFSSRLLARRSSACHQDIRTEHRTIPSGE